MSLGSVKRGNHGGESGWAAVRKGEEGLNLRHCRSEVETISELMGSVGEERMKGD